MCLRACVCEITTTATTKTNCHHRHLDQEKPPPPPPPPSQSSSVRPMLVLLPILSLQPCPVYARCLYCYQYCPYNHVPCTPDACTVTNTVLTTMSRVRPMLVLLPIMSLQPRPVYARCLYCYQYCPYNHVPCTPDACTVTNTVLTTTSRVRPMLVLLPILSLQPRPVYARCLYCYQYCPYNHVPCTPDACTVTNTVLTTTSRVRRCLYCYQYCPYNHVPCTPDACTVTNTVLTTTSRVRPMLVLLPILSLQPRPVYARCLYCYQYCPYNHVPCTPDACTVTNTVLTTTSRVRPMLVLLPILSLQPRPVYARCLYCSQHCPYNHVPCTPDACTVTNVPCTPDACRVCGRTRASTVARRPWTATWAPTPTCRAAGRESARARTTPSTRTASGCPAGTFTPTSQPYYALCTTIPTSTLAIRMYPSKTSLLIWTQSPARLRAGNHLNTDTVIRLGVLNNKSINFINTILLILSTQY